MCIFVKSWVGNCKNPTDDSGFCEEHKGKVCSSCGAQATRDCEETMGPFCCGVYLCNNCEHETAPDGTNGFAMKHCPRSRQIYLPWYQHQTDPEGNLTEYGKSLREV